MFLAKAQGVEEGVAETLVLVKSLQSRDEQQQLDFRREFEMFGKLNHANVVRLLGLCREAEPHYMVLEYVDLVCWGGPAGLGVRTMEPHLMLCQLAGRRLPPGDTQPPVPASSPTPAVP